MMAALLSVLAPMCATAQDDANDAPLGDVARNLRKKSPQVKPVIDDDNLPQVMEKAESEHSAGSALKFLMAGENKGFQVSAPDVTCSLSFSANVKSLLSGQYAQMDLPASEISKLQGQATIEGDALTVPVFNGTDWHVSELAVALTVIRKSEPVDLSGLMSSDPQGGGALKRQSPESDALQQVRAEKRPDVTVIYRMRTAAPPWERAVFSAPLNLDIAPGEEWHWAIVQAKGYPPEAYANAQGRVESKEEMPSKSVPAALMDPENPLAVTPQPPR